MLLKLEIRVKLSDILTLDLTRHGDPVTHDHKTWVPMSHSWHKRLVPLPWIDISNPPSVASSTVCMSATMTGPAATDLHVSLNAAARPPRVLVYLHVSLYGAATDLHVSLYTSTCPCIPPRVLVWSGDRPPRVLVYLHVSLYGAATDLHQPQTSTCPCMNDVHNSATLAN